MKNQTKSIIIHPRNHYILVQAPIPNDNDIVLPDSVRRDDIAVTVVAVAPDVDCCLVGDKLLLRPNPNVLELKHQAGLGLVHDSAVLAIVK